MRDPLVAAGIVFDEFMVWGRGYMWLIHGCCGEIKVYVERERDV